jgi:hypothetical protein
MLGVKQIFDVLVIGGGNAGLFAAMTEARGGAKKVPKSLGQYPPEETADTGPLGCGSRWGHQPGSKAMRIVGHQVKLPASVG